MARKRKPWSELSPAYRRRLERNYITEKLHASGASLRTARGHGVHTRSEQRRSEQRQRARNVRRSARYIVDRERTLKYVPIEAVEEAIEQLGLVRMSIVLEWQEWRKELYRSVGSPSKNSPAWAAYRPLPNLREYVTTEYGEIAWDDVFDEWYDEQMSLLWIPYS